MNLRWARLVRWDPGLDGRWVAAAAVCAHLGLVALLGAVTTLDPWRVLGVPSAPFLFFDTHNLTAAAECSNRGMDPFLASPCDFYDRPWNYPRPWLAAAWLGMDDSWRLPLGVAHALAFWGSAALLVGRLTAGQGVVLGALLASPALMTAIERGQADLLMFVLVALAVVAWRRGRTVTGPVLVAAAGALKLFPAVGLGAYLLSGRRRTAALAVTLGVALLAYVAVTLDDIRLMNERNPEGQVWAYGARILLGALSRDLLGGLALPEAARRGIAGVGLLGVAAAVWLLVRRHLPAPAPEGSAAWQLHAFHLGALIYLGTFAVASNWDYRLIFLVLCLPQLFAWVGGDGPPRRLAAWTTAAVVAQCYIGAVVAYRWLWVSLPDAPLPTWAVADEVVSWLLAGLLVALLVPSVRAAVSALRTGGSHPARPPAGSPP